MFEKLKNMVVPNEHDGLLAQLEAERAEFERDTAARASRIENLETKPIRCVRDIDEIRAEIERERREGDREKANFQTREGQLAAKIGRTADAQIAAAIHQLWLDREATARALSVHGITERNSAGGLAGYIDSNGRSITARINAIDNALKKIESLKLRRIDSVSAAIRAIESQIPALNVDVERFEAGAVIAQELNFPLHE